MITYREMRVRVERIQGMIRDRARETCAAAGLDPDLLGIHPHNAMVSLRAGQPWRGVDYALCRKTIWLSAKQWEPSRILEQWYLRQPPERYAQMFELGVRA